MNIVIRFVWVASHDKEAENWTPDQVFGEQRLRLVNRCADTACTNATNSAADIDDRHEYCNLLENAHDWSNAAMDYAVKIGKTYEAHVGRNLSMD